MRKKYVLEAREGKAPFLVQYWFNLGVGLSQMLSVILGGDPDETVCGRVGKAERQGLWYAVKIAAPFLNWLMAEENHCYKAIEDDEGKRAVWK